MPRPCTVCTHDLLEDINKQLVLGLAVKAVAAQFGVNRESMRRHKRNHLPLALLKAKQAGEVAHANDLVAQIRDLLVELNDVAKDETNKRIIIAAIRERREVLSLLAKIEGLFEQSDRLHIDNRRQILTIIGGLSTQELRDALASFQKGEPVEIRASQSLSA